ncbi:MAG: 1-deoxy-D-xylulose-5-phosphate synthase [Syntrophaceae bacterium PtaB.Bin095]|jgi:1-deoxy-D-xylulose-5-phosphate synthase|nr:MAG: 1-deoxy-D-xylulose-5-phosphate synthase [Syntrophaceae bacterium PtaB.Bin095]
MQDEAAKDSVLARVNVPSDIRRLDLAELNRLAGEIRTQMIDTVSRCGGHLAPSLGTVELTLALHRVFNTPTDKLIWDVGHQAYAHKIITGRKDRFHTLRQKGGISGFPKREESPYDVFNVGHSSTSISAATGIAEARCLKGEDYKIVVVIGDGSMTAGMAYEGLNWAGDRKKDLVIVLNDNEMSISPNVGAMSSYLNRIMTGQTVTKLKSEFKHFLKTIPSIGDQMVRFTRQLEESLKALIVPGALFEELGFNYVGPLEGHRLDHLIKNLENVRKMDGPVLVHVLTRKGKGYPFAEQDPSRFHGIAPFCVETGEAAAKDSAIPTYTQVFGQTMVRLGRANPKVVAITAAMCDGTGLDRFAKEFPDRFYDVGIAEQHGVTFAAGLATEGFIPVVAIYSTFMQRAYDQIIHDVCLQNLPVVLALDRGGFVGDDGPTHHGLFDYAYIRSVPNIIAMAPKDENELQHMLKTATECRSPVSVRYPRGQGVGANMDETPRDIPVGRGEILCDGSDLAIVAIGSTVWPAMAAARKLRQEGIGIRVINARFIKPLDGELLCRTANDLKKIITVEENVLMGGFGSALLELFEQEGIRDVRVRRLGIADEFAAHATQAELRSQYGIDEAGIIQAARQMAAS